MEAAKSKIPVIFLRLSVLPSQHYRKQDLSPFKPLSHFSSKITHDFVQSLHNCSYVYIILLLDMQFLGTTDQTMTDSESRPITILHNLGHRVNPVILPFFLECRSTRHGKDILTYSTKLYFN
jgi:hypothetical protein